MQRLIRRELEDHRILDLESSSNLIILYSSIHTFHIKVITLCLEVGKKCFFS